MSFIVRNPLNVPVGPGQTPLEWWRTFVGTENAGIICKSLLALYH